MANLVSSSINGNFTASGRLTALNSASKLIRTFTAGDAGSHVWSSIFNTYYNSSGWFASAKLYLIWIVSSNTAAYYGYRGYLMTGGLGYGGASNQYVVRDITSASGANLGSCTNSFTSIDNSGFTFAVNNCSETLNLYANLQFV